MREGGNERAAIQGEGSRLAAGPGMAIMHRDKWVSMLRTAEPTAVASLWAFGYDDGSEDDARSVLSRSR